jgi:hypothetical protein
MVEGRIDDRTPDAGRALWATYPRAVFHPLVEQNRPKVVKFQVRLTLGAICRDRTVDQRPGLVFPSPQTLLLAP